MTAPNRRRLERLEARQDTARAGKYDWSKITPSEHKWLEAKFASLPRTAEGIDFSHVSDRDLNWITWLINRCDPRGTRHNGGPDCECGSCCPPDALGVPAPPDNHVVWNAIEAVQARKWLHDIRRPRNQKWFAEFYRRNLKGHVTCSVDQISAEDQAEWFDRVKDISLAAFIAAIVQVREEF